MAKHVLYALVKPQDAQRLAAHDGRLLLIVDNYTRLYAEPPKVVDGQSQVFAVEVNDEQVAETPDNGERKLLVWVGDPTSRTRPQDKVQLPVSSLVPLGEETVLDPVALARTALSELPPDVRLAATVITVGVDVVSVAVGKEAAGNLLAWAGGRLDEFAKPAAAAKG